MASKKIAIGVLILVILTSSFYILLPEKVRIDLESTRTKFSVYEDGKFVLSGIEYTRIFDGTKLMRAKNREINYSYDLDNTRLYRKADFKDGIVAEDFYTFNNKETDVENIPISHQICFTNATNKIFEYLINNIYYSGETKDITSPFSFEKNMKVSFQDGYYRAKVYQNKVAPDKIIVRYRIPDDYECYDVRLFDPELVDDSNDNIKIIDDVKYELLCTPIIVDIKSTENYPCNKTIKIPIYENVTYSYLVSVNESCKSIVNVNKTDFCNISYLVQTIVGYSEDVILSECSRDIIIKEGREAPGFFAKYIGVYIIMSNHMERTAASGTAPDTTTATPACTQCIMAKPKKALAMVYGKKPEFLAWDYNERHEKRMQVVMYYASVVIHPDAILKIVVSDA